MKKRIAVAKSQLLLKKNHSKNKAKNFIACKMCIVSGIPYLSGCREYIHRRDNLYHHMKTIHKIIDPGKASQYKYEFEIGVQTTLQFVKKLQLGDSEPEVATTDDVTDEFEKEAKGREEKDFNKKNQQLVLQVADMSKVGTFFFYSILFQKHLFFSIIHK